MIGGSVGIREISILALRKESSPIHRPPSIGTTHKKKPK